MAGPTEDKVTKETEPKKTADEAGAKEAETKEKKIVPSLGALLKLDQKIRFRSSATLVVKLSAPLFATLNLSKTQAGSDPERILAQPSDLLYIDIVSVLEALYTGLGMPFPHLQILLDDGLGEGEFLIQIAAPAAQNLPEDNTKKSVRENAATEKPAIEKPATEKRTDNTKTLYFGSVFIGYCWTNASEQLLKMLALDKVVSEHHPMTHFSAAWILAEDAEKLDQLGVMVQDIAGYLLCILLEVLLKEAQHFVTDSDFLGLMDRLKQAHPELAENLNRIDLPAPKVVLKITHVLQYLLQKKVSIANLETMVQIIVAVMTDSGMTGSDMADIGQMPIYRIAESVIAQTISDSILLEISPQIETAIINANTSTSANEQTANEQADDTQASSNSLSLADTILQDTLSEMYEGLFVELGIYFPRVQVQVSQGLAPTAFRIWVNQVLRKTDELVLGAQLVNESYKSLAAKIQGECEVPAVIPAVNPINGRAVTWVANDKIETIEGDRPYTWDTAKYLIILSLSSVLRQCADEFVSLNSVEYTFSKLESSYPKLIETVKAQYTSSEITVILRRLANEGISIQNMPLILNTLAEQDCIRQELVVLLADDESLEEQASPEERALEEKNLEKASLNSSHNLTTLTEYVRQGLRQAISYQYTYAKGSGTLLAYVVDTQAEKFIKQHIHQTPWESILMLSDQKTQELLYAISDELAYTSQTAVPILTDVQVRPHLQKIVSTQFPMLKVISYQELSSTTQVNPISRISF